MGSSRAGCIEYVLANEKIFLGTTGMNFFGLVSRVLFFLLDLITCNDIDVLRLGK